MDMPLEHKSVLPDATDVVVIGAGIIGVMTAWELAKSGLRVVVLEKGRVAGEQSSRNWGWIRAQGRDAAELPIMAEAAATFLDVVAFKSAGAAATFLALMAFLAASAAATFLANMAFMAAGGAATFLALMAFITAGAAATFLAFTGFLAAAAFITFLYQ